MDPGVDDMPPRGLMMSNNQLVLFPSQKRHPYGVLDGLGRYSSIHHGDIPILPRVGPRSPRGANASQEQALPLGDTVRPFVVVQLACAAYVLGKGRAYAGGIQQTRDMDRQVEDDRPNFNWEECPKCACTRLITDRHDG